METLMSTGNHAVKAFKNSEAYMKGNIFIPDISGFTKFVAETDIHTGKYIIARLLTVILDSNTLGLQVSEIEGDAILFYKYGKAISSTDVIKNFSLMIGNFRNELGILSAELGIKINLD